MKIVVIGALAESLVNFRGDLIREFVSKGHEVVAMAAGTSPSRVLEIESLGCRFVPFTLSRSGVNPFVDLATYLNLRATLASEKPEIIMAYTIKPVVWAGIASKSLPDAKFYPLITGLGYIFNRKGVSTWLISKVIERLFKASFRQAERVVFQNREDLTRMVDSNLLSEDFAVRVFGSGVNLERFKQSNVPEGEGVFLLVARLIEEKGIRQYAEAAMRIKQLFPNVSFQLLGQPANSVNAISLGEIKSWQDRGVLEYLGEVDDVRPFLNQSSVLVLPSFYGEGVPASILEALATGRPIVTTDNVGCRDTVLEKVNGILVKKRSVESLVDGLIWMLNNKHLWQEMGNSSRKIAESKFDVRKVNADLMKIFQLNG